MASTNSYPGLEPPSPRSCDSTPAGSPLRITASSRRIRAGAWRSICIFGARSVELIRADRATFDIVWCATAPLIWPASPGGEARPCRGAVA